MPDPDRPLRIGTRGSILALTQAGTVRDAIIAEGHPAELVVVRTAGDASAAPVETIGVGVFTAALRDALAAGEVDIAVHSYKDLPTAQDPRFVIAGVPAREDPRDALIARDNMVLGELPTGSKVGTSAPRRASQLRALGLGLDIVPLRGNIDSRIGRVTSGELDAVVLARAGLSRVGRLSEISESLDPVQMLPAPAQGALAIECRVEDTDLVALVARQDDSDTRAVVAAERTLLAELEAGCTAPVGALAVVAESLDDQGEVHMELFLRACVVALDGSHTIRASRTGALNKAVEIGQELARELLDLGARDLMPLTQGAGLSPPRQ
ncbi:hydroxymethylbilane synthase [Hoyosella rhizosphaerae]|uniref:Porphobilinogen deaminase n=1 Tax=Hoyosella rhizosphaerae TaxID=1755582 RepID=A0A916UIT9_9ACTN|nr:hydroxymethylbilane synthase [Hoyosella rhizosphaerae]MBN4928379.1 hydroxymethylbilane synthase [Hoyosella rhizosphaerae]GGC74482.1 porphobilinogen deaminase [Hoyosella rhizosphaerae]